MSTHLVGNLDREARVVLLAMFLAGFGYFMTFPILALILTHQGMNTEIAAGIVTVTQLASQGTTLITGPISDRIGTRNAFIVAIVFRIIGYCCFSISFSPIAALAGGLLTGFGGSIMLIASKAYFVSFARRGETAVFSLRSVLSSAAASVGPAIGALLLNLPQLIFVLAVLLHAFVFWLVLRYIKPAEKTEGPRSKNSVFSELRRMVGDHSALAIIVATAGFWFLMTQFLVAVPLFAENQLGLSKAIGLLFTLNAVLVVLLQLPLASWLGQRSSPLGCMAVGCVCAGIGYLVLWIWPTTPGILGYVLLLSLAEVAAIPNIDLIASLLASGERIAMYIGFMNLASAIGGGLGTSVGGVLYTMARNADRIIVLWGSLGLVGLALSATFLVLTLRLRRYAHTRPLTLRTVREMR